LLKALDLRVSAGAKLRLYLLAGLPLLAFSGCTLWTNSDGDPIDLAQQECEIKAVKRGGDVGGEIARCANIASHAKPRAVAVASANPPGYCDFTVAREALSPYCTHQADLIDQNPQSGGCVYTCSAVVSTTPAVPHSTRVEVPLRRHDSGTLVVEATLAGSAQVEFMVDSGASDVFMPVAMIETLKVDGVLSEDDFLGEATYSLADGRLRRAPRYRLSSITLGGRTVRNVTISSSGDDSTYLLGQSFLSHFRSWSIDNARNMLLLDG
jgi:clan AA aspartic protease (TIGR02281 family)